MRRLKGMTAEQRNEYLDDSASYKTTSIKPERFVDLDKEVAWLSKVLPQFSKEDRLRVVKGPY